MSRRAPSRGSSALAALVTTLAASGCFGIVSIEQARHISYLRRIAAGPEHVAEHERACFGGSAEACEAAGVLHAHGIGIPIDGEKALALYRAGCAADDRLCARADDLGERLIDVPNQARACRREHDRRRCAAAGAAYLGADGIAPSPPEARALLFAACEPNAVTDAPNADADADAPGAAVPIEPRVTADSLPGAVRALCDELGLRLLLGEGVPRDEAEGIRLLEARCAPAERARAAPTACTYLAFATELGLGGRTAAPARAHASYLAACPWPRPNPAAARDDARGGRGLVVPFACHRLGLLAAADPHDSRAERAAAQYQARACLHGDGLVARLACAPAAAAFFARGYRYDGVALGEWREPEGGIGLARDLAARGCTEGALAACRELARIQAALDAEAL